MTIYYALYGYYHAVLSLFMLTPRSPERRDWEAKPCCDMHYTVYARGGERYIIVFDIDHSPQAIHTVASWAANPELSFSRADAGRCYDSINATVAEAIEAVGWAECSAK